MKNEKKSVGDEFRLDAMVNQQLWVMNPSVRQLETNPPTFFQPGSAPKCVIRSGQNISLLKEIPYSLKLQRITVKKLKNFRLIYNEEERFTTVEEEAFWHASVSPTSSDSSKIPLFKENSKVANITPLVNQKSNLIASSFTSTMFTSARPPTGGVDPIATPAKSLEKWKDSLHQVSPSQDVIMTDVQEAAAHILHGPTASFNDSKGYSTEYSQTDRSRIFFDEYGNETVEATRDEFLNDENKLNTKQKKIKTKT